MKDDRLRIGHTADWHVREGARLEEQIEVLRYVAATGKGAGVDLWLVSGDLTGHTVPHRSTPRERQVIATAIADLAAAGAPVVIVTGNHDVPEDVALYGRLRTAGDVTVVDRAEQLVVKGRRGQRISVYCLPYPHKRWLGAVSGGGPEETQQAVSEAVRELFRCWAAARGADNIPRIVAAHINVAGSRVGGGEVMIGREVEVAPGDLDDLGMDYVALGHIHLAQQIAERAWYCGSPTRSTFGEESYPCQFLTADVVVGEEPEVCSHRTPARRLVTRWAEWVEDDAGWRWSLTGEEGAWSGAVEEAEVRLIVQMPQEAASTCPVTELVERLTAAGAHSCRVERRITPRVRVRQAAVAAASDLESKLRAYWQALGEQQPTAAQQERCLSRLNEMEDDGDAVA